MTANLEDEGPGSLERLGRNLVALFVVMAPLVAGCAGSNGPTGDAPSVSGWYREQPPTASYRPPPPPVWSPSANYDWQPDYDTGPDASPVKPPPSRRRAPAGSRAPKQAPSEPDHAAMAPTPPPEAPSKPHAVDPSCVGWWRLCHVWSRS